MRATSPVLPLSTCPADNVKLRALVLCGSNYTYDSLVFKFEISDYAFSKLRAAYKKSTSNSVVDSDFEFIGLVEGRYLTNAGVLLTDDAPCAILACSALAGTA